MTTLAMLGPLARFIADVGKILITDDKLDLAFPTRAHSGFSHHFKWGIFLNGAGTGLANLAELYGIIQREPYKKTDTPSTFLKRVIQIHQRTYNADQEAEETRLRLLLDYFNNITDVDSKEKFQRNYEAFMHRKIPQDVIYGGKIAFPKKSAPPARKKVNLDPPRVYPPNTGTNIKLYRPNT